jgi:uncharacterized protein (TIGR02646 family)
MRSVKKGGGHFRLHNRHVLYLAEIAAGIATSAARAWQNFDGLEGTRHACLCEQFGLCAYSEILLSDDDLGMHVDHVEPKSINQARTFDHANLLLSAISSDKLKGLPRGEVFGGHFRGSKYSVTDFVTPLWADCRRYFHYASSGEVDPALGLSVDDERKARYTIDVLNLNAPLLVSRRRIWLLELEQEIENLLNSPNALEWFADAELCDTGGQLRPFHSAVRQRFGQLGQSVINQRCLKCD